MNRRARPWCVPALAPVILSVALLLVLSACSPREQLPPDAAATLRSQGEAWGDAPTKLPDWTGSWMVVGCCSFPGRESAVTAPDEAGGEGGFSYGEGPGSHFTGAPYRPAYQKLYDARVSAARETKEVYDSMGTCMVPHGMPRIIGGGPGPTEFIIEPGQVTIIWDYMNELRRIYTDGRPHPPREAYPPTVMGHSIGHWESDTLVVDTTHLLPGIYDRSGAPHSDQVHLLERIRRIDGNLIEFDLTIEDPVMFTQPWKLRRNYRHLGDRTFEGSYCENSRNPVTESGQSAVLGSEQAR
jgi:hypothetical protein